MGRFRRKGLYTAQTIRAWVAVAFTFTIGFVGTAGPSVALDKFYFEARCRSYARQHEALYRGYDLRHCYTDSATVTFVELDGPISTLLAFIHDFFPPFGMVLGLIAGVGLWKLISVPLDRFTAARRARRSRRVKKKLRPDRDNDFDAT